MDINSEMGTRSDSTVLTRTWLRWSDNLCPHRVLVATIATRPNRGWPSQLGLNLTGVQCQPWSNGTIVILTDPWRPILRCYHDFVQFFGNTRNVQLVMGKSFGCHPFIKSLSQNGSRTIFVRKFEQIPKRVERWKWLNRAKWLLPCQCIIHVLTQQSKWT